MLNKVMLIGNLGKDPEVREITGGKKVASFSMATTSRWKDRDGNKQEETEWHNVQCWGGLATVAGSYLHKGSKVYIEGRIKTRSYDDKDGNKKYITEIVASEMTMLDGRSGGSGSSDDMSF